MRIAAGTTKELGDETVTSVRRHAATLVRRKWVVLAAAALGAVAALGYSLQQTHVYEASSQVFLSRQNLASSLTGTPDPTMYQQADRLAQTQVDLARLPAVAQRAVDAVAGAGMTAEQLLDSSSVGAKADADVLVFKVRSAERSLAIRLASAYAAQFTAFRRQVDTAALERARREVERRTDELRAEGKSGSQLYADLVDKGQELATMETLQASNSFVVKPADSAARIRPATSRNLALGLFAGLMLGLAFAFGREAFDTRVRSETDVSEILGIPLLGRLPAPASGGSMVPTITEPDGFHAEAFRMLRANLEFLRGSRDARVVMVTSSVEEEGKSTTATNLAVSLAQAGQKVLLVDLDLRRPSIGRMLGLGQRPGLAEAVAGSVPLDHAIVRVRVGGLHGGVHATNGNGYGHSNGTSNGNGHAGALLDVLTTGAPLGDPGEFVAREGVARLLRELRRHYGIVVVDAPPMLYVGDATTLSAHVDGLILVVRLNVASAQMVAELDRRLEACPAERLGYVLTGDSLEPEFNYYSRYTGGHVGGERSARRRLGSSTTRLSRRTTSLRQGAMR